MKISEINLFTLTFDPIYSLDESQSQFIILCEQNKNTLNMMLTKV